MKMRHELSMDRTNDLIEKNIGDFELIMEFVEKVTASEEVSADAIQQLDLLNKRLNHWQQIFSQKIKSEEQE